MDKTQIGRYLIKGEIGRGGMASVFHAHDPRFDRDVAIKILPVALTHDPQFRVRFEREAKTIGLLEHPAIVPVYDFGEDEGTPYIVMRLMNGGSLSERLEKGPITIQEAESIISRIGQALDVAHSKGIVHRDLKPGNILFDQYGNAFLSDFGIARIAEGGSNLTGSQIIGTPAYMSPEQIQGDHQIDGRSDIYALGIILFHMLTKEMPFKADTPAKLMMAHVLDPVPAISRIRPGLPEGLDKVIEKAMQKDPDDRYSTGAQLAMDFSAVAQGLMIDAAPTRSSGPVPLVNQETIASEGLAGAAPNTVVSTPAAAAPAVPKKATPWVLYAAIGIISIGVLIGLGAAGIGMFGGGGDSPTPLATTLVAAVATDTAEPTATQEPTATLPAVGATEETAAPEITDTPEATATSEPAVTATPAAPIAGGADKIALILDDDVWVANLDGSNPVRLTVDGQTKFNLRWLPDGETIAFISGGCIKSVTIAGVQDFIACFEIADYFDGFDVSRDGTQIAISLNRELFITNFDRAALQDARFRSDLIEIAPCEHFAPYDRGTNVSAKSMEFSEDGTSLALLRVAAGATGLQEDQIDVINLTSCVEKPQIFDSFPATRFPIANFSVTPLLSSWDWDGSFLYLMTNFVRNEGFGDLYLYNSELHRGEKINPIEGSCCYYGPEWSPDGRYVFFTFQDFAGGANSTTVFYYVPFATLSSGGQIVPMNFDPLTDPRALTEAAFRPAPAP